MKRMLAVVLAFLCSMLGETVWAQQNSACSASVVPAPVGTGGAVSGQPSLAGGSVISQPGAQNKPMAAYSYWVANPGPARTYVSYGALDQFPFQGRPYGSPSDRWSWYYMGGGNSRYLTRYYYPLLP